MHDIQGNIIISSSKTTKYLQLIFAFVLLGIFAFIVIPIISGFPQVNEVVKNNEKYDIEAGSLFYTETSQFGETDNYIRNATKYSPSKGK